jgi:glycosyltransferase involved in cell wall biosynthesis
MIRRNNTAIICLSPYAGGMELDAMKLAKLLSPYTDITLIAKKGHFIHKKQSEYVGYNGINLYTIDFKYTFSLNLMIKMRYILQENKIENIIFFGASELKSLYFSMINLKINLLVRHGTTKNTPKKSWFHHLIYSKVSTHISNSQHIQNNVYKIIPFTNKTLFKVIYVALPELDIVKHIKKSKKIHLVHVGRIADGKGQTDAIKACEILVKNRIDFSLVLVGEFHATYKDEFISFLETVSYREKIQLVGFQKNVNKYLLDADIFLFPSYGEGLSNAFLEALRIGVVAISYNNTSFPELLERGFYFHAVENLNILKLQETLLEVTQSLEVQKIKSKKNRKLIKEVFSEDKEVDSYLKVLS